MCGKEYHQMSNSITAVPGAKYQILHARQTCEACPSQWECKTSVPYVDLLIHYRGGILNVLAFASTTPLPESMPTASEWSEIHNLSPSGGSLTILSKRLSEDTFDGHISLDQVINETQCTLDWSQYQ